MNRKRCPWCGKIIDKEKDSASWNDVISSPSVPRMLRLANCSHCGHKYGQALLLPYVLKIIFAVLLVVILSFVFESGFLFVVAFAPVFLTTLMPYSKLDDKGKLCQTNQDLLYEIVVVEKYGNIKRDELYFLNDCFDDFKPFVLESPIQIYHISKKSNIISGEFLYNHEKNYDYIKKGCCNLYDTEMNLIAKIKFITDI